MRLLGYAWNAQMGLLYANGGPQATPGSLMCKHGVNLKFIRQDDNGKMQEALTAFATQLAQGNPNPDKGAHFVAIMGDGSAAFLKGLNDDADPARAGVQGQDRGRHRLLARRRQVDGAGGLEGQSRTPRAARSWRASSATATGTSPRSGSATTASATNPDEKTYDPNALNWVNASDYIDAAQKYVAGYSEDRPVVVNGKRTGETKHIAVNGVRHLDAGRRDGGGEEGRAGLDRLHARVYARRCPASSSASTSGCAPTGPRSRR